MKSNGWSIILEKVYDFEFKKGLSSFVNPYSMLLLEDRDDIAQLVDYWYIDGISLLNKINKYYKLKNTRFSFDDTSLAPIVFNHARNNNLKIALIGTEEVYLHKAVNAIKNKYKVNIAYSHHGYFTNQERIECIKHISNKKIDVVICGMGTPYQEEFLIELVKNGWLGYGYSCGGYLHQIAKKNQYYPVFFDRFNIRWIYRIMDEPKLIKRYFFYYPKFFLRFYFFKRKSNY